MSSVSVAAPSPLETGPTLALQGVVEAGPATSDPAPLSATLQSQPGDAAVPQTSGNVALDSGSAPHDDFETLPEVGFEWGLKLGVELPIGTTDATGVTVLDTEVRGGALNGVAMLNVPIALDLGYRTSTRWWWGLEAGAGLGPAGSDCPDDMQCEFTNVRLSGQAIYSLDPGGKYEPWLSVLLGYESLRATLTRVVIVPGDNGEDRQVPLRAKEILGGPQLTVQAGLQWDLAEHLRIGPYASAALGMYIVDSFDCAEQLSCPDRSTVDGIGLHSWLGLGVRGTHGP